MIIMVHQKINILRNPKVKMQQRIVNQINILLILTWIFASVSPVYSYWVDDFTSERPMSRFFPSWTNQTGGYSVIDSRYYTVFPERAVLSMDRKGAGDEQQFWSITVPYPTASKLTIWVRALNSATETDGEIAINVTEEDGSETWLLNWDNTITTSTWKKSQTSRPGRLKRP